MTVEFVRAKRVGGLWIAETALVPVDLIESGAVKVQEVHAADMYQNIERRVTEISKRSENRK